MISTVRKQLRDGVELRSPFDPLSLPAYAVIAFAAIVGAILMTITGFGFDVRLAGKLATWSISLFAAAWLLRSVGHGRIGGAIEATNLVYTQGVAFLFVLFPLAALSGPLADASLARTDALVGFDWPSFARALTRRPLALSAMRYAYASFDWQPLLIVPALALCRLEKRMWAFATACPVGLAITSAIFPLFPAEGAFLHSGLPANALPRLAGRTSWHFGPVMHMIKDQGARYIDQHLVAGIVSFPSYHTTMAALFAWAVWPIKLLRWPVLLLNVAMAVASIAFGAHYLVDIIAGALVGLLAIWIAEAAVSRSARQEARSVNA